MNAAWPEYEEDLKANKVDYTMHLYPKANHGFHNDSTPRYDEENTSRKTAAANCTGPWCTWQPPRPVEKLASAENPAAGCPTRLGMRFAIYRV